MSPLTAPPTSLAITNPLILYRALLATKQIDPDPSQHRLALHLQKLYHRLKDYSPAVEYSSRLKSLSDVIVNEHYSENETSTIAVKGHPLRRNPLFAHLFNRGRNRHSLALTNVISDHEAAIKLDSPRGLLLHGEPPIRAQKLHWAAGADFFISPLHALYLRSLNQHYAQVDILADSLPNRKKRRWHFNTFMLEVLSNLESLRQSRLASRSTDTEYSLLCIAKDMIEKSPIIFLDEFQLPDRAASKILSNLLTTFFQLGGVLIASSNRMPDELAKASGVEYAPPPRSVRMMSLLGLNTGKNGDVFPGNSEFANFLEVLKARCEVWDMQGEKDWRRQEYEGATPNQALENLREEMLDGFQGLEKMIPGNLGLGYEQSLQQSSSTVTNKSAEASPRDPTNTAPLKYLLEPDSGESAWIGLVNESFSIATPLPIPWAPASLMIYGRTVHIPRHFEGTTLWTFTELCGGAFGPADYVTISSTYHTLILDQVPILTVLLKNEARRFITLLDCLYEARCKLIIRAAVGPDSLFFPETKRASKSASTETVEADSVYPETLSEVYQDLTSPFRPNVSSYSPADEDSDFGPVSKAGEQNPDFGQTDGFTGEDERFAYKRARSRLWEMCGARWHARQEEGWWRPLPIEARGWEGVRDGVVTKGGFDPLKGEVKSDDVRMGERIELEERAGLKGKYEGFEFRNRSQK